MCVFGREQKIAKPIGHDAKKSSASSRIAERNESLLVASLNMLFTLLNRKEHILLFGLFAVLFVEMNCVWKVRIVRW